MTKQLEQLTPDTPATLQYTPEFQTSEFVIRGDIGVVQDVDADLTRLEAELLKGQEQKTERSRHMATAAIEALQQPIAYKMGSLVTRIKTDATAALYDRRNGTHFLDALRDKRQTEKDLLMADKLGLLSVQPCAKHRQYLQEVRKIR